MRMRYACCVHSGPRQKMTAKPTKAKFHSANATVIKSNGMLSAMVCCLKDGKHGRVSQCMLVGFVHVPILG
jgi:hypothetical protein